jgi:hypothetical protein
MALLAAGNIRAVQDGTNLTGPKELLANQVGRTVFYKEDEPPSATQRITVKGLLKKAGIVSEPHREAEKVPALLQHFKDLAAAAGGPAPLPAPPDTADLDALLALGGNQQFRAVAAAGAGLRARLEQWQSAAARRGKREERWRYLQRLLGHAAAQAIATEATLAVQGIRDGRQLLDDPDPVPPLIDRIETVLRSEVADRAKRYAEAQRRAVIELESSAAWAELESPDRDSILSSAQLVPIAPPDLTSDTALLTALDGTGLDTWEERIELVSSRLNLARQRAAQLLEPESVPVPLPPATLRSADDLASYVDALRALVQPHLDAGRTVVL